MTKKQIFELLLEYGKKKGLKIKFCKLAGDTYGEYYYETSSICVNKDAKNKKEALTVLAHEIGHHIDYKQGRFNHFFLSDRLEDTPRNHRMVLLAEQSASRWGLKFLQKYGLKNIYYAELDKRQYPWLRRFWLKHYFKKKGKT